MQACADATDCEASDCGHDGACHLPEASGLRGSFFCHRQPAGGQGCDAEDRRWQGYLGQVQGSPNATLIAVEHHLHPC